MKRLIVALAAGALLAGPASADAVTIVARLPRAGIVVPREHPLLRVRVASTVGAHVRVTLIAGSRTLAFSPLVRLRPRRARTLRLRVTAAGMQALGRCGSERVVLAVRPAGGRARRVAARTILDPLRCGPLPWPPPPLSNPQTLALGDGFTVLHLQAGRDYVLRMPPGRKVGGTFVEGGRNVVVIGGHLTVPQGTTSDSQRRALYFKGQTGVVHVEGLLIDGSARGEADGIAINAPQATVQIENVRIADLHGSQGGTHADVVQPWGGVAALRIARLTGTSGFQGLQIPIDQGPIGSAEIHDADLHALPAVAPGQGGGDMLWLTRESLCNGYPVTLDRVYVTTRPGRSIGQSVWPPVGAAQRCAAVQHGDQVSWPALPVSGALAVGAPPGGDYVPAPEVGDGYVSPGYAPAAAAAGRRRDRDAAAALTTWARAPALLAALAAVLALSLLRARRARTRRRRRSPSRRRPRRAPE
jgi:hypothetical protein